MGRRTYSYQIIQGNINCVHVFVDISVLFILEKREHHSIVSSIQVDSEQEVILHFLLFQYLID